MTKYTAEFKGYSPTLKPLGANQGGGFVVSFEVPESEWKNVKDINDPSLNELEFDITIIGHETDQL